MFHYRIVNLILVLFQFPEIFDAIKEVDYRVYDKNFGKVRLPLKPYIALRITRIDAP
jgi:hypothetical protein